MRKRIYVATPISRGDLVENVNRATEAFVTLAKAGLAPFNPAWSVYSKPVVKWPAVGGGSMVVCEATTQGNTQMTHRDWMEVDLPWVAVSDAVLRLPGESAGADGEVALAVQLGIPVLGSVDEVVGYFNGVEAAKGE